MSASIFVSSLYIAFFMAVLVAATGMLAGASTATIVIRTAATFLTLTFLGWACASVLKQAESSEEMVSEDQANQGGLVNVVLPATGEEGNG